MAAEPRRRGTPGGVAIVGVLAMIVGVIQILGGIAMVVFNGHVHGYSHADAVVFGLVTLLVGVIYVWVGRGLLKLNPTALFIGLVVSGIRLAYDVVWLIAFGADGIGFTGIITLAFNLAIFIALWTGRSAFETSAPTAQQAV